MSDDNTDAPERRGPSRAARAAKGGMEITDARVEALRNVRDGLVEYDNGLFFVRGEQMRHSNRRTYGEIRRHGHTVEARGEGRVAMKLTETGEIIVADADAADAEHEQALAAWRAAHPAAAGGQS